MESRKNAMLTTEDRRWLTGQKEYLGEHAKQQRYQRRRDIRERVYNSVLDFTILFEDLDDRERERIFGRVAAGGTRWDPPDGEFESGVRDALAFLLRSVGVVDHAGTAGSKRATEATDTVIERLLTDAIVRIGVREGFAVEDVTLEIEAVDRTPGETLEKLRAGESLSTGELRLLLESELVDAENFQACLRETFEEGGA